MVAKVLQRPTLVLNRNWQPVNVATVARALVLLWNETARVVDPADYDVVLVELQNAGQLSPGTRRMLARKAFAHTAAYDAAIAAHLPALMEGGGGSRAAEAAEALLASEERTSLHE